MVGTCGTFYYETAKFLASYLLPLTENEYSIKTTTDFAERQSNRTVDDDEVLVSYDVSSLFTEPARWNHRRGKPRPLPRYCL